MDQLAPKTMLHDSDVIAPRVALRGGCDVRGALREGWNVSICSLLELLWQWREVDIFDGVVGKQQVGIAPHTHTILESCE